MKICSHCSPLAGSFLTLEWYLQFGGSLSCFALIPKLKLFLIHRTRRTVIGNLGLVLGWWERGHCNSLSELCLLDFPTWWNEKTIGQEAGHYLIPALLWRSRVTFAKSLCSSEPVSLSIKEGWLDLGGQIDFRSDLLAQIAQRCFESWMWKWLWLISDVCCVYTKWNLTMYVSSPSCWSPKWDFSKIEYACQCPGDLGEMHILS